MSEAAGKEFEYALLIQERHLDTFGHVNNAAYLEIFEEARWDLIDRNGYGLPAIRETGLGPVIVEVRLQFKRELRLRERIVVRSRCLGYKGKIGRMEQVISLEGGAVAARGEFTFGLFDLGGRKLVAPTLRWLRAIGL